MEPPVLVRDPAHVFLDQCVHAARVCLGAIAREFVERRKNTHDALHALRGLLRNHGQHHGTGNSCQPRKRGRRRRRNAEVRDEDRLARSEGSLVTPGADSLLTTINQLDPIWVRFSLSESDLDKLPQRRLVVGAKTEVQVALPDGTPYPGKGRLNFAATQIDPRLGTQQVRAEFRNPKVQLLPGQFVRVRLVAGYRDNVFLVPQTAVMQAEKGHFVFVLEKDNKAVIRQVRTGDWVGSNWIILEGLAAGDRVIVDNLLKLRSGAVVNPLAEAESKPAKPDAAPKK